MLQVVENSPMRSTAGEQDEARWAAVMQRDRDADGRFYYAVTTTRVYCRPSCPSRRPRREHVRFHATREAAEAAGFRPCRRCHPDERPLAEQHADAIARACRAIEDAETPPRLAELARDAGMSRFHFQRLFKAIAGVTPREYAAATRSRRLRAALSRGASVTDAIYEAGFGSSGPFYAGAAASLGMTPSAYRSGAPHAHIRFAIGECSLGAVLVAATDRGVCAILLGDDADTLLGDLEQKFPRARLERGDAAFAQVVASVVAFVETPSRGLPLPLDVRGTAFQHRVWQALREVPLGATISYADLAERVGVPGASRAVARACASNAIAVAIPCHRAVRRDGALSGYRWGVTRKAALLERERRGGE